MRWMIGLLLLVIGPGQALGQGEKSTFEPPPISREARIYDQVVRRFNNDIQNFASWEAFKTEVLSRITAEVIGTCYEPMNDARQTVNITMVPFQGMAEGQWEETSDHGWRRFDTKERTFVEYRVNTQANLLLRLEGVKPRFFFAYTRRICEFPL